MPPGVFRDEKHVRSSFERVISDTKLYRSLGATAERASTFGETTIEVRDYQLETWQAIAQARAEGKDSALIHLATGLGKTTIAVVDALDFATDFFEREGRPPKIMFAVHQTEILEQAARRFQEFAPSLTQGYYAGQKKDTDNPLTFATMQSLSQNLQSIDPAEFDYIMYDEAHHGQAETYRNVIEHFTPQFKLALTATPDRMDNEDIRDLFGDEVYSKPLPEAMLEGYLADVDYHIVFDDAVKRAMEAGFTPQTLSEIRNLLSNESRNDEIALQIWEEMEQKGLQNAKTIVFCQDIQQADDMAKLLGGEAYHSGVDKDQRDLTLSKFRSNGLRIITTRDMFNEGVDIPDAQLLVFLRSTSSKTVFEQQLGRGLRKHLAKERVSILDFVANIERIRHIKELADAIVQVHREKEETDIGNTKDGLIISSDHAEFDFDKVSVDLLQHYNKLRSIDKATEEYFSFASLGRRFNIAPKTIEDKVELLGWDLPYLRFGGVVARAISIEQVELLRDAFPELFLDMVPDDYFSISAAAETLGVAAPTLRKVLEEGGYSLERYRTVMGQIIFAISPIQFEEILSHPTLSLEKSTNEVRSLVVIARDLKTSVPTIRRIASELGIEPKIYKVYTTAGYCLSEEEIERIAAHPAIARPPGGYQSINALADSLGVQVKTLTRVVDEFGWELQKYKFNSRMSYGLSPEQCDILRQAVKPSDKKAPEGYVSMAVFAGELGSTRTTLEKLTRKYNITVDAHYFNTSAIVASLSPEAQEKIKLLPEFRYKKAPEGYVSIYAFRMAHSISRAKMVKYIATEKIITETYLFGANAASGLSPDSQELLLQAINK